MVLIVLPHVRRSYAPEFVLQDTMSARRFFNLLGQRKVRLSIALPEKLPEHELEKSKPLIEERALALRKRAKFNATSASRGGIELVKCGILWVRSGCYGRYLD